MEVPRTLSRPRHPDTSGTAFGADVAGSVVWGSRDVGLGVAPLLESLRRCIQSLPVSYAVAVLDSALRTHPLDIVDLEELRGVLPQRLRPVIDLVDRRSESGTESVLRVELVLLGYRPVVQAPIQLSDLQRLDILLGDRLVIECDSEAHHGGAEQRLRDLRRDAYLAALGFVVLRFDYHQVLFELESVLAAVRSYVEHGLHLSS